MARQVFQYKPIGGRLAPMLTVGVRLGQSWLPVDVYVDSGAGYTLLHAGIADGVGFDFRSGELIYLQVGDGGRIRAYAHSLELQVGQERIGAPVAFSLGLGIGFNLLGRASIFSHFAVCFHEREGTFSFEA